MSTLPSAKASRHGARAKKFAPRRNTPLGEGLPIRRMSERICPTREGSPRRKHPDTAHERKDLFRAGTRPSAKAYRHGARAKGFAARERSPRRKSPDTAHGRKGLPHAGTRPTAKASRHGARAKGFAPRGSCSPHVLTNGGPLPTDGQPEKHPFGGVAPDTAHGRKDLPRAGTLSSAKASRHGARAKRFTRAGSLPTTKASRHGARAKGFAPRENALLGESLPTRRTSKRICPAGFAFAPRADERRAALDRRTAGKTPLRRGRTHSARPLPSSFT